MGGSIARGVDSANCRIKRCSVDLGGLQRIHLPSLLKSAGTRKEEGLIQGITHVGRVLLLQDTTQKTHLPGAQAREMKKGSSTELKERHMRVWSGKKERPCSRTHEKAGGTCWLVAWLLATQAG
eukprot:g36960.t1